MRPIETKDLKVVADRWLNILSCEPVIYYQHRRLHAGAPASERKSG